MSLRKTTSLTTLLSFVLLLITSIILYVTPQGKIAFWANWKLMGLGKEQWGALHTNIGLLFIIAGLLHTILNWKPIVTYMKSKTKKLKVFTVDFNVALAITLFIALFTLLGLPPISGIQGFNEKLKNTAAEKYGEPPYGHAEASPLQSFCRRTGMDLKDSIKKLKKAELKSVAPETTLTEIAKANNMTPQQVYNLIKPEPPKAGETAFPTKPGMGFGRKTLSEVCEKYGLNEQATIKGLEGLGIKVAPNSKIKTLAEENNMEPFNIFEAIQQLQTK